MSAAPQTTPDNSRVAFNLLADDVRTISYRPRFAAFLGSATAAILLQQIIYWFQKHGDKPFYKFKEPCIHEDYREGDSWTEELAFSRREFDTALAKIGHKIVTGTSKTDARQALVWYWTDGQRRTFYEVNVPMVIGLMNYLYAKGGNALYQSAKRTLPKAESAFTYTTESTSENTSKTPDIAPPMAAPPEKPINEPPAHSKQDGGSTFQIFAAPKPPKPDRGAKQTPELKDAIAALCKGTVTAWNVASIATSMSKALRELLIIEPDLTADRIAEFGRWWAKNDWRAKNGRKPQPHEVSSAWLDFSQKDKPHENPNQRNTHAPTNSGHGETSQARSQLPAAELGDPFGDELNPRRGDVPGLRRTGSD